MPSKANLFTEIHDFKLMVLAILLGVFDGADLVAMGVTLSRISRDLQLDPSQAGLCASASLLGLVIGAAVCGRLADTYGRRSVLAVATLFLGTFSLITALSEGFHSLLIMRFLAGLGIGGVYPIVVAMAADAATPDFRARATGIVMASGSIGGLIVGLVGLYDDWRLVFLFGGIGPILLLPALLLADWSTQACATKVNAPRPSLRAVLLGEGRAQGTLMIWAISFFTVLANYLLINWLPSLLVHQGMPEQSSRVAALTLALGSIVGSIIGGVVIDWGRPRLVYLVGYAGASACAAILAGLSAGTTTFLVIFATAIFILSAQLATFALATVYYPKNARTTGLGAMVSVGRCGSVVGPIAAGQLLRNGFTADQVFLALVPVFVLSLIIALAFTRFLDRRPSQGETKLSTVDACPNRLLESG